MSRWHDRSHDGLAAWGNLPIENRVADRLADLMLAADDILDMLQGEKQPIAASEVIVGVVRIYDAASALMIRLPVPGPTPSRDDELSDLLSRIDRELDAMEPLTGPERDAALECAEATARPYALALFYEVRRLDHILGSLGAHQQGVPR